MSTSETIHTLTAAEIARRIQLYTERRQQILHERTAVYAAAQKSGAVREVPIVDDNERAAREYAKQLLNGAAPASLSLPPVISRDDELYREQRGLDIVLRILNDKALVQLTADALVWAEKHADAWRTIWREITLTAVRLEALKDSAEELLTQCPDVTAIRWPMGNAALPLSELIAAALQAGIVTDAEIRKAEKC
jgi:hypothetical protein